MRQLERTCRLNANVPHEATSHKTMKNPHVRCHRLRPGAAKQFSMRASPPPVVDEGPRHRAGRPLMNTSPKLRTFVHKDFSGITRPLKMLSAPLDACLFCLGISAHAGFRRGGVSHHHLLLYAGRRQHVQSQKPWRGFPLHQRAGNQTRQVAWSGRVLKSANGARSHRTCRRRLLASRIH